MSNLKLIDNYIYLHHLPNKNNQEEGTYVILPVYPDTLTDSMGSTFAQQNPLSRTAPIFAWINSGPRTLQVTLPLHRDLMDDLNYGVSNIKVDIGDDYVDTIIKQLQAIALPSFNATAKSIEPPMVTLRFGDEIFITGVVTSGITVTYGKPILSNNKYAQVSIAFTISEITPFDAQSVAQQGSFRGMTRTFKKGIYD